MRDVRARVRVMRACVRVMCVPACVRDVRVMCVRVRVCVRARV